MRTISETQFLWRVGQGIKYFKGKPFLIRFPKNKDEHPHFPWLNVKKFDLSGIRCCLIPTYHWVDVIFADSNQITEVYRNLFFTEREGYSVNISNSNIIIDLVIDDIVPVNTRQILIDQLQEFATRFVPDDRCFVLDTEGFILPLKPTTPSVHFQISDKVCCDLILANIPSEEFCGNNESFDFNRNHSARGYGTIIGVTDAADGKQHTYVEFPEESLRILESFGIHSRKQQYVDGVNITFPFQGRTLRKA